MTPLASTLIITGIIMVMMSGYTAIENKPIAEKIDKFLTKIFNWN